MAIHYSTHMCVNVIFLISSFNIDVVQSWLCVFNGGKQLSSQTKLPWNYWWIRTKDMWNHFKLWIL